MGDLKTYRDATDLEIFEGPIKCGYPRTEILQAYHLNGFWTNLVSVKLEIEPKSVNLG